MWDQYVIFTAKEDSVNLSMITEQEKESLQKRLEAYLARFKWRNPGFYQVLNSNDTVIKIAEKELSK